jgi:hypothetical protein
VKGRMIELRRDEREGTLHSLWVDVPRLVRLLGGTEGADVLDLLEDEGSGTKSYELETVILKREVPYASFSC